MAYRHIYVTVPNDKDTIGLFMGVLPAYTLNGIFKVYRFKDSTRFDCLFLIDDFLKFKSVWASEIKVRDVRITYVREEKPPYNRR